MIGIVKGSSIAKNKDSDIKRVLLQVEFVPGDVKTIELMSQAGENINPGVGCRVMIVEDSESYKLAIAVSDDIEPDAAAGEKEFYSTDSPVVNKLAKIKLNSASEVVLNDGTDYAVKYEELKKVVEELQDDITTLKNVFSTWAVVLNDGGGALKTAAGTWFATPLAENMTATKVEKVRLP